MTLLLPAMFHWSPHERHMDILNDGLRLHAPSLSAAELDGTKVTFPYICLSPTPSCGWSLSGDMGWETETDEWDLWQIRLVDGDEVHILPQYGNYIKEVRVRNAIPADRVWFVGTRPCPVAQPEKPKRKRAVKKK